MKIQLCNSKGQTLCGSDGAISIDGRLNFTNVREEVSEYKNRFKANFTHKFDYWTHFKIVPDFRREYNCEVFDI